MSNPAIPEDAASDPANGEIPRLSLTDGDAVRLAYSREIVRIAELLRSGFSVLVTCDKLVAEHLWEAMVLPPGRPGLLAEAWAGAASSVGSSPYPSGYPYLHLSRLRELLARKSPPDD